MVLRVPLLKWVTAFFWGDKPVQNATTHKAYQRQSIIATMINQRVLYDKADMAGRKEQYHGTRVPVSTLTCNLSQHTRTSTCTPSTCVRTRVRSRTGTRVHVYERRHVRR